MSKFKERAKDFAARGLNRLPDNANLFLRYMTGLGGRNLDLDDKTISKIREASKEADRYTDRFDRERRDELGRRLDMPRINPDGELESEIETARPFSSFTFASENPRTGAVNPYGTLNKDVIQTLGRFQSRVNPSGETFNVRDRYDMLNEAEDPDLVSGKLQPIRALRELSGVFGPSYGFTSSPKTRFARALMYGLPVKPKGFDINIDIPMTGDINNRERYR